MPTSTGIDRNTGKTLSDWAHVQQSLLVLFSTSKNSRIMRRAVGAGLRRKVDSPISPNNVIDIYAAVSESVAAFEPRFRISRMQVENATAGGQLTVAIQGVYYPRGLEGDFSVSEPQTVRVPL